MTEPTLLRADARHLPLADACVDLIVTSPPYWALRSYTDGGQHYDGQIGAEPTPAEYIDSLIECTREWMRVLKPTGSLWVNLDDKYAVRDGQGGPQGATGQRASRRQAATYVQQPGRDFGVQAKSRIGLPWRYAIRCIDDLGLILRAEVIWSKPNGLPESVTDRVRRAHETWFHLTRSPRYFSAVDAIREPSGEPRARGRRPNGPSPEKWDRGVPTAHPNVLGKLPGSVWEIATQPLKVPAELGVDHFAAFPVEWPRRIILGWSPSSICTACGEGRRPVTVVQREHGWIRQTDGTRGGARNAGEGVGQAVTNRATRTITGEACACPDPSAPTRPAVVLDPFGGTGTTALVADAHGRHGISVDMSADYQRIARWRTTDPGERANALGVARPAAQIAGQGDLLDLVGDAQ